MTWAAVAVVGGSLIGGAMSVASSQSAAKAQVNASNQATQLQQEQNAEARRQYDISRADLAPYRTVGYSALSTLAGSSGLTPPAGAPAANPWTAPAAAAAQPAAPSGGQTPGMLAAMSTALQSGRGGTTLKGAFLNPAGVGASALGLPDPLNSVFGLGKKNNSALQDIRQALELGRPISDASWAQAGFGPGGSDPRAPQQAQQPQAGAPSAALPAVPLDQANPTVAPPGTNAPSNDFNRKFTLADFQQDPGYEFRRSEGQRGVEASASARGGLLSGGTLKALDRYNQDYASGEYGKAFDRYQTDLTGRFNRLSSLAGTGQTATNQTVNAGTDLTNQLQAGANNISNNIAAAGNARSSGYVAAGNAVGNAAGNIGQYYALKSFLTPTPAAPVM